MIDPAELNELYVSFLAGAEFEFEDEVQCMAWCAINGEFLKWLAEENRMAAQRVENNRCGAGSFEHMRRLFSVNA